jgi:hypothetical protein
MATAAEKKKLAQQEQERSFYADIDLSKAAREEQQRQFDASLALERLQRQQANERFYSDLADEQAAKEQDRANYLGTLDLERRAKAEDRVAQAQAFLQQRGNVATSAANAAADAGNTRGSYFRDFRNRQNALIDQDVTTADQNFANWQQDIGGRTTAYNQNYENYLKSVAARKQTQQQGMANWETDVSNRVTAQQNEYQNYLKGIDERIAAFKYQQYLDSLNVASGGGGNQPARQVPTAPATDPSTLYVAPGQQYINNVPTSYGISPTVQTSTRKPATPSVPSYTNPAAMYQPYGASSYGITPTVQTTKKTTTKPATSQYLAMQKRLAY